jgi:hypothetical protein
VTARVIGCEHLRRSWPRSAARTATRFILGASIDSRRCRQATAAQCCDRVDYVFQVSKILATIDRSVGKIARFGASPRSSTMSESDRWQYENDRLGVADFVPIKAEIERLGADGRSLWRVEPIGESGVVLRFKYPGEWTTP